MIKLFLMGYIQVMLVTAQTYMIARESYAGVIIVGFFLRYVWTANVKRAAFGTHEEKIIYSAGAAAGAISGMIIAKAIIN